jgi:hypothetical protein
MTDTPDTPPPDDGDDLLPDVTPDADPLPDWLVGMRTNDEWAKLAASFGHDEADKDVFPQLTSEF